MKLKIISDGTAYSTRIIDAETGVDVTRDLNCTHLEVDAQDGLLNATLTLEGVSVDVVIPNVLIEHEATLIYDPDDIDSLDQAIAALQQQRAARVGQ